MDNLAFTHGGNIYEIEKKYKRRIIDFSANINPLGLPGKVKQSLCKNFDSIQRYPDSYADGLAVKIAMRWGISNKNILTGNGSVELIYLVVNTFKPKTVLIPAPAFSEYERASRNAGARIKFLKLDRNNGFKLDISGIAKPDIFFLCQPNNPTGNFLLNDCGKVEQLAKEAVFIDEAFMDFSPDEEGRTMVRKAAKGRRIIVLRTFTKMFAMPGLRIGYLVANEDIISKLRQRQPPWSVNSIAQLAAEAALDDKEYIISSRRVIKKEREFLVEQLNEVEGLKVYPSLANFLLIRIENRRITSLRIKERLLKKGILIRDCANFRGLDERFIRVAVRTHKENMQLVQALEESV